MVEDSMEYEKLMKRRPHVVILGAGASVAAIPNGDKNGKQISVMNNFFQKTQTEYMLKGINLKTKSMNLEDIYNEIYERNELKGLCANLEKEIYKYFSDFVIPDEPTIYDYLVLSLRNKDLIASFNWDPLLCQAYKRCTEIVGNLPKLVFLHGNTEIAICVECRVKSFMYHKCSFCGNKLSPVKLLYPIKNKNYSSDIFIKSEWNVLRKKMQEALVLTIFGYSAPSSDIEAINLLKQAWGDSKNRIIEEVEIIDIKEKEELIKKWSPFTNSFHYKIYNSFFKSHIACFPRRTCECHIDQNLEVKGVLDDRNGFTANMTWQQIKKYLTPILEDEMTAKSDKLKDFWLKKW